MGSFCIQAAANSGLAGIPVTVEVDISSGLPKFTIVGLPDAAISESRDRVRAAIKNSGLTFPRTRVTINLAPADVKKQGPMYDLPIALGILAASGAICVPEPMRQHVFLGELSLDGGIRPISGALLAACMAKETGKTGIVVPKKNAKEAALVASLPVFQCKSLREIVEAMRGERTLQQVASKPQSKGRKRTTSLDMQRVRGQGHAKRALEIAAAGGHNVLLSGPPGSGKTLLARAVPSILPDLNQEEALEITKIQSVAGLTRQSNQLLTARPFRAPHHSSSSVSLIGGGTWPKPGEVSLAHRGVLFLDELPEFPRSAIENLRQPLEDGIVTISRAAGTLQFPAQFMLVAAMNPCPCGFVTDPQKTCVCPPHRVQKYQQKISGPLMDRIDLLVEVPRVKVEKLTGEPAATSSKDIRTRVQAARNRQAERYKKDGIHTNAELSPKLLETHCRLQKEPLQLLKKAIERLHLSARAYTRILKVSRTIADLAGAKNIASEHIAEALQYRPKET